MRQPALLALVLAAAVFVSDYATKRVAEARLSPRDPLVLVENHLDLVLVKNPGVAFGLLADLSPGFRQGLLVGYSVLALGVLTVLVFKTRQPGLAGALGLILGGAAGNLVDRLREGAVTDFIYVHWYQYYWPAFNVADSAITVGMGLVAFLLLRSRGKA